MKTKNKVSIAVLNYLKFNLQEIITLQRGFGTIVWAVWLQSYHTHHMKLQHKSYYTHHMKQQHFAHSLLLTPPKHNQLLISMHNTINRMLHNLLADNKSNQTCQEQMWCVLALVLVNLLQPFGAMPCQRAHILAGSTECLHACCCCNCFSHTMLEPKKKKKKGMNAGSHKWASIMRKGDPPFSDLCSLN